MARTVTLALSYRCNNDCAFCFLGRRSTRLVPDPAAAELREFFARNAASRRYSRLIVSGAEPTLRPDLAGIVRLALEKGGFSSVQLQTNGRRLADPVYCRELVAAGVGEFLVSVHAASPALYRRVCGPFAGFAQMRRGLRNVLACGARLITNTVVSSLNYRSLPDLADSLLGEGVRECRFWHFLGLEDGGQRRCQVRLADSLPPLAEALDLLEAGGVRAELSWFPRCLLGRRAALLRNYSSPTVIAVAFRERLAGLSRFFCPHSSRCPAFRRSCLGLHEGYVRSFGEERTLLRPQPSAGGRVV